MGEIADMMLDGTLCEGCGVYLDGESYGVPRYCASCERDRLECRTCGKASITALRRGSEQ